MKNGCYCNREVLEVSHRRRDALILSKSSLFLEPSTLRLSILGWRDRHRQYEKSLVPSWVDRILDRKRDQVRLLLCRQKKQRRMTSDAPYQLDLEMGKDPRRSVVMEHYHHHDGSAISSDGHRARTTKKQPRRPGHRRIRKQDQQHDRSVPVEHSLRHPYAATTSPLIIHESRKVGGFGGGCCLCCSLACLLVLGCCVVLPVALVLVGYLYLRRQMESDYSSQAWQDYWNGGGNGGDWKDNYQMDDATISNYFHQYAGEGDDDNILAQYSHYFWQWWEGSNGDDHDGAGD